MKKQDLFLNASRQYIEATNLIRNLCNELSLKYDKHIIEFDIIIQVSLLYLACFDEKITEDELDFIDKIATDTDIIKIYNEKTNNNLTWKEVLNIKLDKDNYIKLIDNVYMSFSTQINNFIVSISAYDASTIDDYINSLKGYILNIGLSFLSLDEENSLSQECFNLLNDKIFKNMDNVKNAFLKVEKINI